ncbi:MAG: NADH-quinone oxidoreductase subunit K, partial [Candidatus Margulisiibacteriota bacterium]
MIGLTHYLVVSAALFCIGAYGVVAKKNAIAVLMGVEFILNAVNLNL